MMRFGCLLGLLLAAEVGAGEIFQGKFESLFTEVQFAEGPACGPDGAIFFTDIPTGPSPGRILRFDPKDSKTTVFRADSAKANGLCFDLEGRLVACEGADFGGRRISRSLGLAKPETVVDNYQGRRFNAPNDLCVDGQGRIWFTDPKYLGAEKRELEFRGVFRIEADGALSLMLTQPAVEKPNGIAVAPDGRTLYVADTNNEPVTQPDGSNRPGAMRLLGYSILRNGALGARKILVDFAPEDGVDGMSVDSQGRIFAAVRSKKAPGIRVYSPAGVELDRLDLATPPTNCEFGRGDDKKTLYITLDNGFGRVKVSAEGYHPSKR